MADKNQEAILGPMRLPFLILPPACALLGAANAYYCGHDIHIGDLILILIGSILAHISVNAFNEYDDFHSGLDLATEKTPFSGGSGALPDNPDKAHFAAITGWVSLTFAFVIGIYFIKKTGLLLLPVILAGFILVITYTKYLTRKPVLCLISPGLAFGTLMVMGTDLILSGSYSFSAFFVSLVPFFLVNNLLLLNQFPDIDADRKIGRKHLPISIGTGSSVKVYGLMMILTYISIIIGYYAKILPGESFLALGTVFVAVPTFIGIRKNKDSIPDLIPFMGQNVFITIVTPALLAVSLFIAG